MREVKAVLLVGGLGTRLRSLVPSSPKALASVGHRPFLELLIQQLSSQGIRQLVMCTGYLAEQIEEAVGNGSSFGVTVEYSRESSPLGTAGALKLTQRYLQDESEFLVLNGDSFLEIDFNNLIDFHRCHGNVATVAVAYVENAARYGTVQLDANGRVQGFVEKTGQSVPGTINAGVYVFGRPVLSQIPDGPASLEREVFPKLLAQGLYAYEQQGMFIDIGTPEDYERAKKMCDSLASAAIYSYRNAPSGANS